MAVNVPDSSGFMDEFFEQVGTVCHQIIHYLLLPKDKLHQEDIHGL